MSRRVAIKSQSANRQHGQMRYLFDRLKIVSVCEDTEQCDGIGGIVWEGSIVLAEYLKLLLGYGGAQAMHDGRESRVGVIELGAGTGLTGMAAALCGAPTVITDRIADLALQNVKQLRAQYRETALQIDVQDYSWSEDVLALLPTVKSAECLVIVGAEIACLIKQHDLLVDSIQQLFRSHTQSIAVISFDGLSSEMSKYEHEFVRKMNAVGFASAVVSTGCIRWETLTDSRFESKDPMPPLPPLVEGQKDTEQMHSTAQGYYRDLTSEFTNDLDWLTLCDSSSLAKSPRARAESLKDKDCQDEEDSCHHLRAFFRMSSLRQCTRCHRHLFPALPASMATRCRHHRGKYVCRQHPAETSLSVNGLGDKLGYYGTGEAWKACFWDCCGVEDENDEGCVSTPHTFTAR